MAYQSLYRKYRSKDFSDLIGQRHVTQTLANAIAGGRVSHAYLFCGPRGTGKTSTARVLAKSLNCVNGPTAEPCDVCPYCIAIRQGSAMDVIEIDAASNRNIDDIRQLREQVNYPPVELRYKFYIVDEVHQLTRDSFNAFLKTLEEPPGHVIFVLCTTDPHQLPATILSRCQRFDFHRISLDEIVGRLRWIVGQEGWTVEDEALYLLARVANGGMRDALSLLDQAAAYAGTDISAQHVRDILGGIDLDLLLEFTALILARDANGLFRIIDRVLAEGKDVPQLVSELILHWRNLLRVAIGGEEALVEFTPGQREQMAAQARQTDQAAIMRGVTLWCEAENELRWNSQQRLLLELYGLRMMTPDQVAVAAAASAAAPTPRPAPRPMTAPDPAPVPRTGPSVAAGRPVTPAPAPPPQALPTAEAPPSPEGALTLPRMKIAWPAFIDWMRRSEQLDALRARIVEKSWPHSLIGQTLTLGTASPLTRSQVIERPRVRETLEKCLVAYFKETFIIEMRLDAAPAEAAPAAAAQPPAVEPAPPAVEPVEPQHDIVGERMREVFASSREITSPSE